MRQIDRRRLMHGSAWGLRGPCRASRCYRAGCRRLLAGRVLFTRINGGRYYDAETVFASLAVGMPLVLHREPGNAYDRRAMEVLDAARRKLGYTARIDNSAVARITDAGERFEARVARLTPPLDIRVTVGWLRG